MKLLLSILVLLSGNTLVPVHDVPVAIFHITESDGVLFLDVNFDVADLSESIGIKSEEVTLDQLQDYLSDNTTFIFNGKTTDFQISEINKVRDHIKAKGRFDKVAKQVQTIQIENTCLNDIHHHSNVVQIDLNDKSRDFRMSVRRTKIEVNYSL